MTDILNFARITTLALADSVNPCALAVFTMILTAILIQNPDKREKVLYGGIAFICAVYGGYLFYGLVLVHFFKTFAELLRTNLNFIYDGLAIFSMILGALNIKDFFIYKPGGIATEMPIWMRPKVKKIIQGIVSPQGAFVIGLLITIFLLPCTIGPYVVASGLLSQIGIVKSLPWLLYYNLVFVLPMIIIVGIIYFGFKEVDEVAGWKERNIKRLHLIAGILLFTIGISMLMGWI